MSHSKFFFIDGFISVFFLIVFFVSCSPTSNSPSSSGASPSEREAGVQLKSTLGAGITGFGSGSQSDPFEIFIDESVSLERPFLALSELFSNVASVAEGQSKVGTARLDIKGLTVEPDLGSKLSIELQASNNEKKYANLYFQDSARLTNAVQSGEAVLDSVARGGVAKAVEVVVTVYKEEVEDESWNVALDSLFDYNEQKFDVTAFKEGEETQNARFVHEGKTEITDFANYTVTEETVVELVFEPKEGVDPLLYPARSQLLKLVPDAKVMSCLAFNDTFWNGESSKWTSASKNRNDKGESPERARVLKSVWNAQLLDLSSYVEVESEELSVYLYEAENVNIISPPTDGIVQAGDVLKSPQFSVGDNTRLEFRITGESAFAIFEFRTLDNESENVVGKKLYVKVELALAPSIFKKVGTLSDLTAGDSPGDGSEGAPYVFGVTKDKGVELSALIENNVGVLAFAVKEVSSADFTTLTGSALSVNRGVLARGALTADSWVLRISAPGTIEYKPKELYFQLTFPRGSSSLELADAYKGDRDGSEESPVEVTVLSSGITLSSLTTPVSTGKTLSYEVVTAGSGLAAGTLISNASLKIGDTVEQVSILGGSFVLKVSEPADDYTEAADFYFRLVFETPSLEPNIIYSDQTDNGASFAAPIDAGVFKDTSLTLTDLIAPYGGAETYSLEREGEDAIALSSDIPLRVGEEFGGSSGVTIAADIPWFIKVTDAPSGEGVELYFKVTFAKNSSSFRKSDSYSATGSGAENDPYVSAVVAADSLVLANLTIGKSAGGTLSYTVDGTATTAASLKMGEPFVAGGTALSAGEKTIVVSDSGDDFTAGGIIYFKVNFTVNPSNFNKSDSYTTTAGEGTSTFPFIISNIFAANTAVDLTSLVNGAAGTLSYAMLTSAADTGTSITNPASALSDKAGESVVVRVIDSGSLTVAGKTLYLNLAFATVLPSADNRYTAAFPSGIGRTNGPEVALTGSMTAGEISFSVELLPNTTQVIYSTLQAGLEFKYEYRDVDGNDNRDLVLYSSQDGLDHILKNNLPAGVYNFTLVKSLSDNGYTVALSVTGSDDTSIVFDSNSLTNDNAIEITNNNVQAFTNPVIGADVRDDASGRPVRVVNNVRWVFQPSAPQVSLKGGSDFSALTAGAIVGSTFFVRVPDLVVGDTLELFSVVSAQTSLSWLETRAVAAGATSLEFAVTGLTHNTSYEFLVKKPASSSAHLLDSPRSVAVTVDTSVPATTASFIGLGSVEQNGRANLQGLSLTPVNEATDVFAVGDQIFLYEINASNERVAVGNTTGLVHAFDEANFLQYTAALSFPTLNLDLRTANFEERAYNLVVEVVTLLGNKADVDFTVGHGATDTVFSVTLDSTQPQLSFNFTDTSTLVISADEALAEDAATAIQNGLTFTGTDANPTVSTVTHSSGSYTVSLSSPLIAGAVLNLAAGTVTDVAGNANVGVQQNVLPSLLSVVAGSNRIGGDSSGTALTFNFAQEIDAATFNVADDLEIIDAGGTILTSDLLTLGGISPASGSSQTVTVTLTAHRGFDAQVRVRMKTANEISLPSSSLTAEVSGQSGLIDIDRQAPTPSLTFATTEVGLSTAIEFTLSFDEAVTGTLEAADFQVGTAANLADATAAILSNIIRKDETTFIGTLTTPGAETAYSLVLKANAVTDAYANTNSVSNPATINVTSTAVPIPSFSAAPLPRHGGSTTLTISFPEAVTGFDASDLIVTDANSATNTVLLGVLSQTANDYTVTLTTQNTAENTWTSGDVTVSVAPNAYQNASNQGSSPALSYTVPVSSELTAPALVSVTDGTTTVTSSADLQTLPLSGIRVNVNVSAVAGDTLDLFLGSNPVAVATQTITTTGTQLLTLSDTSSKVNGSRLAYSARLQDAQANISESSSLLFVTFEDNTAATPPEITGPVSNVSFADDFSSSATSWDFRSGRATGLGQPSTLPGSAEINSDGVLQLNDARNWQYALATQNDLIFSTQGRVVFEGTFIFGNSWDPGDGIAFFAYDARDELFYGDRGYSGNGYLVVTHGRLRSLFFAIGLNEFRVDSIRYAAPGTTPADLSSLGEPTAGNTSGWNIVPLAEIWSNARHRLRITTENRGVVVEYANVDANGVVDKNSWREIFNRSFTPEAYVPDNIKIGFSSATGGAFNYHAIDDVSVDAQLFVPYQINSDPVQAAPRGVALTAGEQANNGPLAIAGIRVEISSGYRATDSLTFSGNLEQFSPTLSGEMLIIRTATGQSATVADFLGALNAINFSATELGSRTLRWQVFALNGDSEVPSQFYSSQIQVFNEDGSATGSTDSTPDITSELNSPTLVKKVAFSVTDGTGTSSDPYITSVTSTESLTLADLTTGKSAGGTLSYTVDGTATQVSSLQIRVNGFTAGTKTIVVTDSGDNVTSGTSLYFDVTFEPSPSTFVKDSNYITDSGAGTESSPYVSTVAAETSLNLADLTTGKSADGALSYAVDGTATTSASLKVGEPLVADGAALSAGEKTIIVTDSGDSFTAGGVIYFKVTFAFNSSNFKKSNSYATTAGEGTSASPYESTVAAEASLALANLTTGKSAAGTLSYTVDGAATTAVSLKVGEPFVTDGAALSAGEKTIIVTDSGDSFTAGGVIYFKVTFAFNSSNFKKSNSYATTAGEGTSASPYESTVAAEASLALASLTADKSAAGTLSYTVDGIAATTASLKVGESFVAGGAALSAGEKTIIVTDSGDSFTAGGVIYFKVTFAFNSSNFKKSNSYATTAGEGTSASPYESTVAAEASLALASLTADKSAGGTLSYTVDGITATTASLKVGESFVAGGAALSAGEKTIIVTDSGDNFTAGGVIYFKVTFTEN